MLLPDLRQVQRVTEDVLNFIRHQRDVFLTAPNPIERLHHRHGSERLLSCDMLYPNGYNRQGRTLRVKHFDTGSPGSVTCAGPWNRRAPSLARRTPDRRVSPSTTPIEICRCLRSAGFLES